MSSYFPGNQIDMHGLAEFAFQSAILTHQLGYEVQRGFPEHLFRIDVLGLSS